MDGVGQDPFRKRRCYIALGSNLGDRESQIECAMQMLDSLAGIQTVRASSLRETQPVGFDSQNPFLNAVVEAVWQGYPETLLIGLQMIEQKLGRDRRKENGAYTDRTIDMDIIWMEDVYIQTPRLTIPHPRAHEREFVLGPLAELNPELARDLAIQATGLAGAPRTE